MTLICESKYSEGIRKLYIAIHFHYEFSKHIKNYINNGRCEIFLLLMYLNPSFRLNLRANVKLGIQSQKSYMFYRLNQSNIC